MKWLYNHIQLNHLLNLSFIISLFQFFNLLIFLEFCLLLEDILNKVDECLIDESHATGSRVVASEVPVAFMFRYSFVQSLDALIN